MSGLIQITARMLIGHYIDLFLVWHQARRGVFLCFTSLSYIEVFVRWCHCPKKHERLGHSGIAEHMFGDRKELGKDGRTRVPQEMIRTCLKSFSDAPIGYVEAEWPCGYADQSIVLFV